MARVSFSNSLNSKQLIDNNNYNINKCKSKCLSKFCLTFHYIGDNTIVNKAYHYTHQIDYFRCMTEMSEYFCNITNAGQDSHLLSTIIRRL